jgi:hypothetical protein
VDAWNGEVFADFRDPDRRLIIEKNSIGLTVLRRHDNNSWIAATLTADDVLWLEPDVDLPVAELYENVDFPDIEPPNPAVAMSG